MLPWGHVAFGYALFSLGSHLARRGPPGGAATLTVAVAALLPDLVDKPLSWSLGWFPQGYSVIHSVFVAVPVGLVVLAAALRRGRPDVGAAFVVGYWSHLVGDVAEALLKGYHTAFARVLWPVHTLPPYAVDHGLVGRLDLYLSAFVGSLTADQQLSVLAVYLAPYAAVFVLWLFDGAPVLSDCWRLLLRLAERRRVGEGEARDRSRGR